MKSAFAGKWLAIAMWAAIFCLAVASPAAAQKKPKNNGAADNSQSISSLLPVPIPDQIDHDIGEMLGAFQVGDVEAMHKYYADNATFVSDTYEPPVMGWANYVTIYQRERAAFPSMQILRRNTFIFHNGDVAWASYQWQFLAQLDGQPFTAQGQTTLIFNKVGTNWLIVHNHTSEICAANTPAHAQPARPASAPPYVPDQH